MSTKRQPRPPRTEFAPRWTPSPRPEVDLLYLVKFLQRHTLALDDGDLAPESAGSHTCGGPAVGLSWAFLKAVWRREETSLGLRCVLCDEALLLYRFRRGGHRAPGLLGAARRCAACAVVYEELGHAGDLAEPLGIAAPVEVADGLMRVERLSLARASEAKVKPHDAPRWTRRLPQCPGTYVVAALDGRARSTRQVSRDPRTLRFRDEAPEPWEGWWWSRPVAWELLPPSVPAEV